MQQRPDPGEVSRPLRPRARLRACAVPAHLRHLPPLWRGFGTASGSGGARSALANRNTCPLSGSHSSRSRARPYRPSKPLRMSVAPAAAAEAGQAGAQGIPGLQGGPRPPTHPRLDLERAHVAVPEGADRQREPRGDWVSRRGHARQAANGVADHAASEAGFLRRSSLSKSQGATRKFCRAPT